MTSYFECCHYCVAPKRYAGCSGKCPEYKAAREKYDADKAKEKMENHIQAYSNAAICARRDSTVKHLKSSRRYIGRSKLN